jgi:hypothetical protein
MILKCMQLISEEWDCKREIYKFKLFTIAILDQGIQNSKGRVKKSGKIIF